MRNSDIIKKDTRPKSKISVRQDKFLSNNISMKGKLKITNNKFK